MAGAGRSGDQKPEKVKQAWRERFEWEIVGSGIYSGGGLGRISPERDVFRRPRKLYRVSLESEEDRLSPSDLVIFPEYCKSSDNEEAKAKSERPNERRRAFTVEEDVWRGSVLGISIADSRSSNVSARFDL